MRVSELSFFDNFAKYSKIKEKDLERYTKELSSGKKILAPSDGAVDHIRSLRLKELNASIEAYGRNMDMVSNVQDVAESALSSIVDAAQEAKTELIQLHNIGVLDEEDAKIIKEYLGSMRDYIVNQANTKIGDTRLFGGVKSDADPFDASGTYGGALEATTVAIANGVELNTTFSGADTLGVNTASGKIAVVEALDKAIDIIDNALSGTGTLSEIETATIPLIVGGKDYGNVTLLEAFDIGLSAVMQHRSMIGSQKSVNQDLKLQNETLRVGYSELVSKLEDADFTDAINNLEKTRTAYEAILASFAQNKKISLLNYL